MNFETIAENLKEKFGEQALSVNPAAKENYIVIQPQSLKQAMSYLRNDLKFDFLMSLTAVDLKGLEESGNFRMVYHLYSYENRSAAVLKTELPRDNPEIETVSDIWATANWHEREVFDLFGIRFNGHPDLRRIMLPDEWEGHPLRKDFVEKEGTFGISTVRENLIDTLKK
ncbi:MAG: NADH-quinone oxidoreductase subunit C [Deltaproteobacteria bacterium]|nr:NADH-quinone oxidoreductase subunit C [Deltaproteobacteria bacterium]